MLKCLREKLKKETKLRLFKIILFLLALLGAGAAAPPIPIIMYHHIRQPQPSDSATLRDLSCAPETFTRHVEAFLQAGYQTVTFEDIARGQIPARPVMLTVDDGYQDAYVAYEILRQREQKAVFFVTTRYLGDGRHLTPVQLREMARGGMEIGSHSISHPDLTALSLANCKKEIAESKKFLEDLLGKKIISFCYPSGRVNADVRRLVKNSGYLYARTTRPGLGNLDTEPHTLRVFRVHDNTLAEELLRQIESKR
ncbi:MAG: polysaccharide deacetylase family protein [Candidatus Margulisbacteria bacterium]|jgi:peptidoglycan/xylan/chitin deacetylase (PgdA/CDA1 family)|nr:polysaccharide deacetylase family protein [Candidatus Margulisiibacteriota bacterium]